jgi:hypothetical protein
MISEKEFASGFTGFWGDCLPFLAPPLIAELNLSGVLLTESGRDWVKPLGASRDTSRNDVIAEMAFGLFVAALQESTPVAALVTNAVRIKEVADAAVDRIQGLRRRSTEEPQKIPIPATEAFALAYRLEEYFEGRVPAEHITIQPRFKGCGILNSCYGDLFASKCLYELKCVDRNLRSVDLRQVLVYCALNYGSQQFDIAEVTILNPRRGIEFRFVVEDLASRVSGKTSAELFHQIRDFLSNFEVMHQAS